MQPIPIGIDSFREIREKGHFYVDKTLMIADFIKYDNKVALITRPRRFGKTLNMTMLREFFDNTKDSRTIFDGLAIMETEHASQLNSKPVIFFTFKNASGATMEDMKDALASEVLKEYIRFFEVFDDHVDRNDLKYTLFYETFETLKQTMFARPMDARDISQVDTGLFRKSLTTLIKAVSIFYDTPPLVLIDEYDQPLINAHIKGYREAFSEDIYSEFLGEALKGNEHLGQNLLTGIQRVAKESIFSKLNNFAVYSVVDEFYAPYFGLTEAETAVALQTVGLELTKSVKNYYDGYCIGGNDIYNPWSILNYMFKKKLEPYWINTSTNALIRECIMTADAYFKEDFDELILNGSVEVLINLTASFLELASEQTLWGLLVNAGYLTFVTTQDASEFKQLRFPNEEVRQEFRIIVANYAKLNANRLTEMFKSLMENKMEKFLKAYERMLTHYLSCHDIKGENSYHMFFLGMAISTTGMYKITSNMETGDGRGDIIMESLHPTIRPHIIIEFKQGTDIDELKQVALDQIFEKKYYAKLQGSVLCIGLAHDMKKCALVSKIIN